VEIIELTEFYGKSTLKITAEMENASVFTSFQNKYKFIAQISGDLSLIDFPEITPIPARKNELWTIGCFEIFVSKKDNSYTEHNFGFCTNWECFDFDDYRKNQSRPQLFEPKITCKTETNKFTQIVEFHEKTISQNQFSITAVVKLKNGDFLYFANKHCGQTPDFHLKSARNLKLL